MKGQFESQSVLNATLRERSGLRNLAGARGLVSERRLSDAHLRQAWQPCAICRDASPWTAAHDVWATSASPCLMHSPFHLSKCAADHRRRATGIAPTRSSGIEREARRSSECRGAETRSLPSTDLREPVRLSVCVLSRNRGAGILAEQRISASAWFCG